MHGDREIFIFPVQLIRSRIGNLTRLIHTLLYVMNIHIRFCRAQHGRARSRIMLSEICKHAHTHVCVFFTLTDRASTMPTNLRSCQSGTWSQRGTKGSTGCIMVIKPATQTNRDPNRDKILAKSYHLRTSGIYRRQDYVFGFELQLLLSGVLPVTFQNLREKLQRRLMSDVLAAHLPKASKSDSKHFPRYTNEDKLCDTFQGVVPTNIKRLGSPDLLPSYIESNPDRFGLLSPTHGQRSQRQSGRSTLHSVLSSVDGFE